MQASRTLSTWTLGVSAGLWRWAALAFGLLALAAASFALLRPDQAGFAGYALLGGIAVVAALLFYAVWPREGLKASDAKRVAEAAARANVAWAITGPDGAVLDCNPVYRRMAGTKDGESAAPPELALAGEPSSAVLYRLSRDAAEGRPREESFVVMPGLEIVAAVRPLKDQQTVWWFTPRLAASVSPQPVIVPKSAAPAAPAQSRAEGCRRVFSVTRPWAWRWPTRRAISAKPMPPSPGFSARPARSSGASVSGFVDAGDRAAVNESHRPLRAGRKRGASA